MSSENGFSGSAAALENESAAQKLLAKHKEAHPVEIEEVVDEEDLAHPPPSAALHASHDNGEEAGATAGATMSDIAQGKKKANDAPKVTKPRGPTFDVKSEEAFPALGGPTPRAAAAASQGWGKPPQAIKTNGAKPAANGASNGTNGRSAPGYSVPSQRMQLPGRHAESITLLPNQIAARKDLKKPINEIIRDINKRSKATVVTREGPQGIIFEGTGPQDAVQQALKDIVKEIGTKVRRLDSTFGRYYSLTLSSCLSKSPFLPLFVLTSSVARELQSRLSARRQVQRFRFQDRTVRLRTRTP